MRTSKQILILILLLSLVINAFAKNLKASPKGLPYYPQTRDELIMLLHDESIRLDSIDTSRIKDFSFLFARYSMQDCKEFGLFLRKKCMNTAGGRQDFKGIEAWDMSAATSTLAMFAQNTDFNHNISSWNVSNVKNANLMFSLAKSFNQPLQEWNVSGVLYMSGMFAMAYSFNQPLDSWNVSSVKDMSYMFTGAYSFNQPLKAWDIQSVKNMDKMFWGAKKFCQNIDNWNVSRVKSMKLVFDHKDCFAQWYQAKLDNALESRQRLDDFFMDIYFNRSFRPIQEEKTRGDNLSTFSIMSNIFGTDYGFEFDNGIFTHSPIAYHGNERVAPLHHFGFDIGHLALFQVGKKYPQTFGGKIRYEYGFQTNKAGTHRFGIEAYWHPFFLNVKGWQLFSIFSGMGYRNASKDGYYMDNGILILPTSPLYFSLNHRMDFAPHTPMQQSIVFSVRMSMGIWSAPVVIPAFVTWGIVSKNKK